MCMQGQFVGVVGKVGSGKSSLLMAITAEMRKAFGQVRMICIQQSQVHIYFDGFWLIYDNTYNAAMLYVRTCT